jgi:hypothetical protein
MSEILPTLLSLWSTHAAAPDRRREIQAIEASPRSRPNSYTQSNNTPQIVIDAGANVTNSTRSLRPQSATLPISTSLKRRISLSRQWWTSMATSNLVPRIILREEDWTRRIA